LFISNIIIFIKLNAFPYDMVFEIFIAYRIHQEMLRQAATLDEITPEELAAFESALTNYFSGTPLTELEGEAKEKAIKELYGCPRTRLEVAKVERDLTKVDLAPKGNARLYGLKHVFLEGVTPEEYNPMKHSSQANLWGIADVHEGTARTLLIEASSSIGELVSGQEVFRLYGIFKDYSDPAQVTRNFHSSKLGYPILKVTQIPTTRREIQLPLGDENIPAFLLIGNIADCCGEALAYVGQRFYSAPDEFHKVMETRAAAFPGAYLKDGFYLRRVERLKELEAEVAKLEKVVGE